MSVTAIELARALANKRNLRKTERTLPPVHPPKTDEVDYRKDLLGMLVTMNNQIEAQIFPLLDYLEPQYVQDTPRQDVIQRLNQLEGGFGFAVGDFANRAANLFVEKVSHKNSQRLKKSFNKAFGISLPALTREENIRDELNDHIKENVELIKSIPKEHFEDLRKFIGAGVTEGRRASDLRQIIRERYDITERRARFIARDQTSKLNGNLTSIRAQNAGSDRYRWDTREDDLVRPGHAKLDGKTYSWKKPPDTGNGHNNPGEDFQCRCVAHIIIDI